MSNKVISIGPDVEDTYFKFQQQAISDIVDALHKNDHVQVEFTEGVALEELNYKEKKFLHILEELFHRNSWPKDKISFVLPNLIQDKSVWPRVKYGNASITSNDDLTQNILLGSQVQEIRLQKDIKKTFGIFINRSQWDRLLLSSYLYAKNRNITMQTYRKNINQPEDMLELDLDRLFWKLSSDQLLNTSTIEQVCDFIASLPHELGQDWHRVNQQSTVDATIMSWYNNIFVDVVCEKMITGQTFFPTEKIARPLATKTPFLVMAAPNYIKNLRRLGFKSFSQFWDESYDYQQGVQRIESIQKIIDYLAKLDKDRLNSMHIEMLPILEHNYKIYQELTGDKILEAFNLS